MKVVKFAIPLPSAMETPASLPSTTNPPTMDAPTTTTALSIQKESIFFNMLPAELRAMVYRELLTNRMKKDWPCTIADNERQLQILRTCKAIYQEAMPILYGETIFPICATNVDCTRLDLNRGLPNTGDGIFSVGQTLSNKELSYLEPILKYRHLLRKVHIHIRYKEPDDGLAMDKRILKEAIFRHHLECVYAFLEQLPKITYLRIDLSKEGPDGHRWSPKSIKYQVAGVTNRLEYWSHANHAVESVLGGIRNVKKVDIIEGIHLPRPDLAPALPSASRPGFYHTGKFTDWSRELAGKMMCRESKE